MERKQSLEQKLETVYEQFGVLKLRYDSLQKDHQTLYDAQSTMRNENEERVKGMMAEMDQMNGEMDGMKQSLRESQTEIVRKDIDIEALRRATHTADGQMDDHNIQFQRLLEKNQTLKNERVALQKEMEGLQGEIERILNKKNENLLKQNHQNKEEREREKREYEQEISEMKQTQMTMQNQVFSILILWSHSQSST